MAAGGGGARRGAGETKLELDRRYLRSRIEKLESRLKELEKRRGETRRARQKNGVPVISLVGYTNVGKSSLTNALCGAEIFEADMLFATLDPTARKCSAAQRVTSDPDGYSRLCQPPARMIWWMLLRAHWKKLPALTSS